jgi:hypothetical protein
MHIYVHLYKHVHSTCIICVYCSRTESESQLARALCRPPDTHRHAVSCTWYMVCSRTCLVLSPYAHPKAWLSRSNACKFVEQSPSVHRLRATLSALTCLFVHHLAARPESLGVIAWLLYCSSLAACAKDMVVSRPHLMVAMNTQTLCPQKYARGACFAVCVHEV